MRASGVGSPVWRATARLNSSTVLSPGNLSSAAVRGVTYSALRMCVVGAPALGLRQVPSGARTRATLALLGAPRYLGADPGLAQLPYQAQLDVFLTALSGVAHAAALAQAAGIPPTQFVPEALQTLVDTPAMLGSDGAAGVEFETGVHPGHLSTATMMGATAAHVLGASEELGVDTVLPRAILSHYEAALAAGHGGDNWSAIFEVIKARPAAALDVGAAP